MKKFKKTTLVLIYITMNLSLLSCNTQKKEKVALNWKVSVGAPKYYPSKVLAGGFGVEGKWASLPTGAFENSGWGEIGCAMSEAHFVPDSLLIYWFSYVENKFFKGEFALPADTIRALFEEGVILRDGSFETYDYINVNTYPDGGVAVWLITSGNRKVEIGHYKGEETTGRFKDMYRAYEESDRDSLIKELLEETDTMILENFRVNGLSPGLFQGYRQRYPWRVEIQPKEQRITQDIFIEFFNGERDVMWGKTIENNYFKQKAVPKYVLVKWVESDNGRWGADINFDEQETFEAYRQMYKNNPNVPTKLVLVPDYDSETMKVYLRSDSLEYELRKTHNGLYPRTMD